jgi:glutaredoxin
MNALSHDVKVEDGPKPTDSADSRASNFSRIKDLAERFRVCWEVDFEQAMTTEGARKIGFSLELYGTHEPGTGHVEPGCDHCREVQSALKQIALWILPREHRPSMYEVNVVTQALSYSRKRRNRPDVRVTIRILHRTDFEEPVDECETRCLDEMEHALSEVGACKSFWKPSTHA